MKQNRNRTKNSRAGRGGMQKFQKLQAWDTWIGTLLQRMCSRFCSRTDTTGQMREGIITPAGLQTCNIVNEEETYYSQSDSAEIGSDSPAECTTSCPSYCRNKVARRNPKTYSKQELPDGVRSPTSGELASFRLRRARLE